MRSCSGRPRQPLPRVAGRRLRIRGSASKRVLRRSAGSSELRSGSVRRWLGPPKPEDLSAMAWLGLAWVTGCGPETHNRVAYSLSVSHPEHRMLIRHPRINFLTPSPPATHPSQPPAPVPKPSQAKPRIHPRSGVVRPRTPRTPATSRTLYPSQTKPSKPLTPRSHPAIVRRGPHAGVPTAPSASPRTAARSPCSRPAERRLPPCPIVSPPLCCSTHYREGVTPC